MAEILRIPIFPELNYREMREHCVKPYKRKRKRLKKYVKVLTFG